MSTITGIEWTDSTFNPWRGCTKVSPGCANCYAETLSHRNPKVLGEWGPGKPRVQASESYWREPLKWNLGPRICTECGAEVCGDRCGVGQCRGATRRRRVFCASLSDWLDEEAPIEWLARLLQTIHATPNLDWQLLTKRPQNWTTRLREVIAAMPEEWDGDDCPAWAWMVDQWVNCDEPPENVWIGTTVEDQIRADERIPKLLQIPAAIRFLSCEPLLTAVDLSYTCFNGADSFGTMPGIHWVICGGESGTNARSLAPDWARSLRDQCERAKVPFFFKQWGEWKPCFATGDITVANGGETVAIHKGELTAFAKLGKKRAGSLLDGREHKELPR